MTPRKDIPLKHALWFLAVGEDRRTKLSHVRVAAYLVRHADESGSIASPEITDAASVAQALDIGFSSVHKALASLDSFGFIAWEKPAPIERLSRAPSRVSLILDHIQG